MDNLLSGINLELIAQDPQTLMILQILSRHKELEATQKRLEREQIEQRQLLLEIKKNQENLGLSRVHGQYYSVTVYATANRKVLSMSDARAIDKIASNTCKMEGIQMGEVSDQRYGRVKTYPIEILKQAFEQFFSED